MMIPFFFKQGIHEFGNSPIPVHRKLVIKNVGFAKK